MASLYDAITNPKANPLLDSQTQQIQSQLQAASGKALASPVPTQVNLAERVAQKKVREEEAQVTQELQRAEAEQEQQRRAAEIEQEFAGKELNEQALNMRQQMQQKATSLLSEFIQGQKKIETQRDQAKAEVAAFLLRLGNEKYINDLRVEGTRSRLENNMRFGEELQRSIWQDELDLLNRDITAKAALRADERTFQEWLSTISVDQAIALAMGEQEVENYKRIASGTGQLMETGIQAAPAVKNWWDTQQNVKEQYSTGRAAETGSTMSSSGTMRAE